MSKSHEVKSGRQRSHMPRSYYMWGMSTNWNQAKDNRWRLSSSHLEKNQSDKTFEKRDLGSEIAEIHSNSFR